MYRGFVPDFLAGAFQSAFSDEHVLFDAITLYCKERGTPISMDEISYSYEGGYPSLNCKGFDAKIIALFLAQD